MPTDSLAAAVAWRRLHLDPAATWEQAARKARAPRARPAQGAVPDRNEALERIGFLRELATADFDKWGEHLRAAMAALPRERWDGVKLPVALWERLIGESGRIMDGFIAQERAAAGPEASPSDNSIDDDSDVAGDLMFMLAAGLAKILPECSSADVCTLQREPAGPVL